VSEREFSDCPAPVTGCSCCLGFAPHSPGGNFGPFGEGQSEPGGGLSVADVPIIFLVNTTPSPFMTAQRGRSLIGLGVTSIPIIFLLFFLFSLLLTVAALWPL
jgi:hypothetical protein